MPSEPTATAALMICTCDGSMVHRKGAPGCLYRHDGSWSCTRDHVTEPCGDCGGCRRVRAENTRTIYSEYGGPDVV